MLQRTTSQQIQSPLQPSSPKLHHSVSLFNPSNPSAQKLHQLFNIPDFKTNKIYQKTIRDVLQLLGQFDKFTDNLQSKVDMLLARQQNQFVDGYKQHMKKIQNQFQIMQQKVKKQEQLIKYYENQGKMSNLIKKVALLQQESKKLYEIIAKKDKQIKSIKLENIVQKQEMKRMFTQIKQMNKAKNQQLTQNQLQQKAQNHPKNKQKSHKTLLSADHSNEQHRFFTTQVQQQKSVSFKKDLSITTDQNKKAGFSYNLSQKSILCPQTQPQIQAHSSIKQLQLQKQLHNLTLKHRKLAKINSKVLQDKNQLQNLFIRSVAQIKRQIIVKKKIRQCTFEDFKKQDKINLLLIIISNQEILRYVYEKIFGSKHNVEQVYGQAIVNGSEGVNSGVGVINGKRAHSTAKNKARTSALPYI